jgi:alpha-mannosidase
MQLTAASIVVVPHTHWDREWYLPFQRFRLRLVALLDEVIDRMERDPRWHFTLDGQMAAVDDYLEIRPERRDRVAALVREGRLAVGPWQILHDEFLCSGENIVRNLELGLRRAEELGAAMMVGYLPDQFGHTAQTPQILRQAGIEHACLWRGVPAAVGDHAFAWVAPDGTAIRTEYLSEGGYGNAAGLFNDPGRLAQRATEFADRMRAWRPDGGELLAMYGSDHTAPAADLADQIESVSAGSSGSRSGMRLDTLAGYMAAQETTTDGLPRIDGELRSHARANILPGVISARIQLKQAMGRAERLVERYAEPLSALWFSGSPQRFLDMAWRRLIEVSCHDSVTGCGCDETAEQVAARMAEAEQIGRAVCDMVTAELATSVPNDGLLIVNPTPARRTGLVTLDLQTDLPAGEDPVLRTAGGRLIRTQTLEVAPTVLEDSVHPAADLPMVLGRVYGRDLFGRQITDWSVSRADRTLTFEVARASILPFDVADVHEAIAGAEGEWRLRILAAPCRTVAALVDAPPLGHTSVRPEPAAEEAAEASAQPVTAEDGVLDNGLVRVEVQADGTLSLRTPDGTVRTGLGRLVDGGDLGDTYNYAPPATDRIVDAPLSVRVDPVWSGPLVAAVDVVRGYSWPAAGDVVGAGRSAATEDTVVTTRVELRAGEPYVRLRVTFDNRCDDHRVRLHLPLPVTARSSFAEGQFAIVERGLTAEGGCGEEPLPTFPASAFVAAGGLAVLLEHVSEYELVDDGAELALTLLRSVGYLSRNRHAHRDAPAGPQLPTPTAQCRGERTVSLAIMPYGGDRPGPGVIEMAEAFRHDLLVLPGYGSQAEPLPPARAGVAVGGDGVVLTSLRERGDGWVEARLVAEHPVATTAVLSGAVTEATLADLRGRPGAALPVSAGAVTLPLRPWEIATVRLRRG